LVQARARGRQAQPARGPIEQHGPELLLQLADLITHRGLSLVQDSRCAAEAACPAHLEERLQGAGIQVHKEILSSLSELSIGSLGSSCPPWVAKGDCRWS